MVSLDLPRRQEASAQACDAVEAQASEAGWSVADVSRIGLAIVEAVANAVEHGPSTLDVGIRFQSQVVGDTIVARIADGGGGPNVGDIKQAELPADPFAVDGRGLYILRQLTDGVEQRGGDLILTFKARP